MSDKLFPSETWPSEWPPYTLNTHSTPFYQVSVAMAMGELTSSGRRGALEAGSDLTLWDAAGQETQELPSHPQHKHSTTYKHTNIHTYIHIQHTHTCIRI